MSEFYKKLGKYSKGEINSRELLNEEDSLYRVIEKKPYSNSVLVFDFKSDEDLLSNFDISDDDIWFARAVYDENYEFYEYYQVEEDFKEGYSILGELDDDNKEILKEIILISFGKEVDDNFLEKNGDRVEYADFLLNYFPDEMDHVIYSYVSYKNGEMNTTAIQDISSELNSVMDELGFEFSSKWDQIKTTIVNLRMWYVRTGDTDSSFKELFEKIAHSQKNRLGGWQDNAYEFYNPDNFDSVGFNRDVYRYFNEILEEIKDNPNIDEIIYITREISSKFKFDKWYSLPKDSRCDFKIGSVNKESLKIKVLLKLGSKTKSLELSRENFYNLLYQPELFKMEETFK